MNNKNTKKQISPKDVLKYWYWRFYGWKKYQVVKPRKPSLFELRLFLPHTGRLLKKALFVLLVFCLNWYGILAITNTSAYFSDIEISDDNRLQAGVLDMKVEGANFFLEDFEYGNVASTTFEVSDLGTVEFLHGFRTEGFGDLCEFLVMDISYSGEDNWRIENVPLLDFDSEILYEPGTWAIELAIPDENKDKQGDCVFDYLFEARQFEYEEYWDKDEFSNLIGTKFVPEPPSCDDGLTYILLEGEDENITWDNDCVSKKGYKVVWSKTPEPTYPVRQGLDRYHYFSSPDQRTDTLTPFDGDGEYYVRVCEYLGGRCGIYSNEIKVYLGELPAVRVMGAEFILPEDETLPEEGKETGVSDEESAEEKEGQTEESGAEGEEEEENSEEKNEEIEGEQGDTEDEEEEIKQGEEDTQEQEGEDKAGESDTEGDEEESGNEKQEEESREETGNKEESTQEENPEEESQEKKEEQEAGEEKQSSDPNSPSDTSEESTEQEDEETEGTKEAEEDSSTETTKQEEDNTQEGDSAEKTEEEEDQAGKSGVEGEEKEEEGEEEKEGEQPGAEDEEEETKQSEETGDAEEESTKPEESGETDTEENELT